MGTCGTKVSALGSRQSPNFLGVRSVFVLPRPTFLFAASTPSSSSSRRCHRLPRYPSLPSDVKRRAREAGYTARLAPSFCDLARGCPAAGSQPSTSFNAAAASGPQVHRRSHLPRRPSLLASRASSDDARSPVNAV